MDGLYNRVYNGNGQCLGPLLNTAPFRSPTSGGLNRCFKIRNNTNTNVHVLIKNGEFEYLSEAKQIIKDSVYRYDGYFAVKPGSMGYYRISTYSFYILCYVMVNGKQVILFEDITNRFSHIVISDELLLKTIKEESKETYVDYLREELQKTRDLERKQTQNLILNTSGHFDKIGLNTTPLNSRRFNKKDYIDFTRSDESKIRPCMTSLLRHSYAL